MPKKKTESKDFNIPARKVRELISELAELRSRAAARSMSDATAKLEHTEKYLGYWLDDMEKELT